MYNHLLFDLDGTLTDPKEGITNSIVHALNKMKITAPDHDELVHFIGPPLKDSFEKDYGLSGDDNVRALKFYREYFADRGLYENAVYPGIEDFLNSLKENGYHLYVATSKPIDYAQIILDHFDLSQYFDGIAGSELDGTRNHKAEVIQYVIEEFELHQEKCVMIGDRKHDLIGAELNQMDAIGVLYGYGSLEELSSYPSVALISDVASLKSYFLGTEV
ncbi:HAD family hydrolase [Macrococcus brunensis]|uniref:HAD family hydrolase n=1 Tax=Macrococcus brunensis TaxID=198483 RepID=UPI001EF11D2C|nr:HAD family hydrolase [Macrococcus brunensis]ULG71606.1 HAD family hydrolase [Macrococcus brunensis]ULG73869.1 HAD family hydrolase [Macrococcus brunensis]